MGRIRSIKPELIEDEITGNLNHLEWRMFVSMFLIADDYGNLRGALDYVVGNTLWASRDSRETLAKSLETLVRVSLVCRYRVRGQTYLHINGWSKHQRVDKPGKPHCPAPTDVNSVIVGGKLEPSRDRLETLDESSRDSRETLVPDLRSPTSDPDHRSTRTFDPTSGEDPEGSRHVVTVVQGVGLALVESTEAHSPTEAPSEPVKLGNVGLAARHAIVVNGIRPLPNPPADAMTPAYLLLEYVTKNHPEAKVSVAPEMVREATALRWGEDFRKLHEVDGIPYPQIAALIHWCQREDFWKTNILSASGLRKNWDRMAAQRKRAGRVVPMVATGDEKKRRADMERDRNEIAERDARAMRDRDVVRAELKASGLLDPDPEPIPETEDEDLEPEAVGDSNG